MNQKIDKEIIIRRETEADYRIVETITRDAFWDLQVPGCNEHYLAHVLRDHEDFIPELDLVAEIDGQVVANVMYVKAKLVDEKGEEKNILSFGPFTVAPAFQRHGVGRTLLEKSFEMAKEMGYDTIVIFGHPCNYIQRGFKSCKKYNVCLKGDYDIFPTALLVKELKEGALDGRRWYYKESPAYEITDEATEEFDKLFEKREKTYQPSQEEFYIYSHSTVTWD